MFPAIAIAIAIAIDIDKDSFRLGTGSGRGLDRMHPLGGLADLFPQLLLSGARFG